MRLVLAAAFALLLPLAAEAQPKQPTRDFAVTYRVQHEGEGADMRVFYSAATRRQRVEMPVAGMAMINDIAGKRVLMLNEGARVAMELPLDDKEQPMLGVPDDMVLTRTGSATVAGHRCTVYRAEQNKADRGTVCVTDDGIMLSAALKMGEQAGRVEATALSLATQPAELFQVPPGWRMMQMPQGQFPGQPPQGQPGRQR